MRITPDNPLLVYSGRIDWSHRRAPVFIFPCTSVSARFTGQVLKVHVENRHAYWDNYLGYLLDGEQTFLRLPENGTAECEIPIESSGEHEFLLFKRQDACHELVFLGLEIGEGNACFPPDRTRSEEWRCTAIPCPREKWRRLWNTWGNRTLSTMGNIPTAGTPTPG